MFNLIYKDLFIQKKYMKTLIINILLCYIVIAFINTSAAYIVNPFLITLSFFMYACGFGDKNDADNAHKPACMQKGYYFIKIFIFNNIFACRYIDYAIIIITTYDFRYKNAQQTF